MKKWTTEHAHFIKQIHIEFSLLPEQVVTFSKIEIYSWNFNKGCILDDINALYPITNYVALILALYATRLADIGDYANIMDKYKKFNTQPIGLLENLYLTITKKLPMVNYTEVIDFIRENIDYFNYLTTATPKHASFFTSSVIKLMENSDIASILNKIDRSLGVIWSKDSLEEHKNFDEKNKNSNEIFIPLSLAVSYDRDGLIKYIKDSLKNNSYSEYEDNENMEVDDDDINKDDDDDALMDKQDEDKGMDIDRERSKNKSSVNNDDTSFRWWEHPEEKIMIKSHKVLAQSLINYDREKFKKLVTRNLKN